MLQQTSVPPSLADPGSPVDLLNTFTARVADWTDCFYAADAACSLLHALPGCDGVAVFRLEPEAQRLVVLGVAGACDAGAPIGESISVGTGIAGRAVREREMQHDGAGVAGGGEIAVAVRTATAVFGVLLLRYAEDADTESLAEAARVLSAPLAVALQLSIATGGAQVTQLRQHLEEYAAIVEVGQALTSALALDEILTVVAYSAEALMSAQCAAVALPDPESEGVLVMQATTGVLMGTEGTRIPLDDSLLGWVARTGETVISRCISDDPRTTHQPVRQGPGIVVPILSHGEAHGSLLVARAEGAPTLSEREAEALRKMASYAGIAIENARLYREQTETASALREQAEELQNAYSALQASQDQLLVSEKMAALGRITAGIAHEINSPLASILNALQMSRGYLDEYRDSAGDPDITIEDHHGIADDIQRTLELADAATQKVAQFVRSIKSQTRAGDDDGEPFDPAAEVDAAVILLQHELRKERVAIFTEMDRGLHLAGDRGKYGVVLQNLLRNAIDAFESGGGEIWVRVRGEDDRIVLAVEDQGGGIPEDIRSRIFDYLFTTKGVGKGTGLGLSMVHSIVTTHFRGEVQFQSEVGKGTTFTVTFPYPNRER